MTPKHPSSDSDDGYDESVVKKFVASNEEMSSEGNSDGERSRPGAVAPQDHYFNVNFNVNRMLPSPNGPAPSPRPNRQKKKDYLEHLEAEIDSLKEDNLRLKSKSKQDKKTIKSLREELRKLKLGSDENSTEQENNQDVDIEGEIDSTDPMFTDSSDEEIECDNRRDEPDPPRQGHTIEDLQEIMKQGNFSMVFCSQCNIKASDNLLYF